MSTAQSFVRVAGRAALGPTTRSSPIVVRQAFRSSRRGYSSQAPKSSRTGFNIGIGAAALVSGGGCLLYGTILDAKTEIKSKIFKPTKDDYQKVYNYIAKLLEENDEYDDGSYGPVVLRLSWHCSGTYDKETGTGGSNGATMRFAPEMDHGANSGLKAARDFLEPVKGQFPWITYSDLWTLAGVCAVQEMQGPAIQWRPGRQDHDVSFCTPDGRLPDGSKDQNHLRAIFGRMGFNDQEIVALSGAHALGRCHTSRSGFDGPWTYSPTVFSNDFFTLLFDEKWTYKKWNGPKQFEDSSKSLMMLPTDMVLVQDEAFRKHAEVYAKSTEKFYEDFGEVFAKLLELGVPFKESQEKWTLTPTF